MSKFYTYAELANRPTLETVTVARDQVVEYIQANLPPSEHVVYGSTIWGRSDKFENQHTMRSDIDIAQRPSGALSSSPGALKTTTEQQEAFDTFLKNLETITGVPIQVIIVGKTEYYNSLINPSTADHFRLLAAQFPQGPYKKFKQLMNVNFKQRYEDLGEYMGSIRSTHRILEYGSADYSRWQKLGPIEYRQLQAEELSILSTLENFPDHFLRKVLGMEKRLPCPDSKRNVREALRNFPYKWNLRDELLVPFEQMFECTADYEKLLQQSMLESEYKEGLGKIAKRIMDTAALIFQTMKDSRHNDLFKIIRIPKESWIVTLNHNFGSVQAGLLSSPFGNLKEGLNYPLGFAQESIYGTKAGEPLVKGHRETDIMVYRMDRNLSWIVDPPDPVNGWFAFKHDKNVYSIKAIDPQLAQKVKEETKPWTRASQRIEKRYYKQFCQTALNPKISAIPKQLTRILEERASIS